MTKFQKWWSVALNNDNVCRLLGPLGPLVSAIYVIETVIDFNGIPNLAPPSVSSRGIFWLYASIVCSGVSPAILLDLVVLFEKIKV